MPHRAPEARPLMAATPDDCGGTLGRSPCQDGASASGLEAKFFGGMAENCGCTRGARKNAGGTLRAAAKAIDSWHIFVRDEFLLTACFFHLGVGQTDEREARQAVGQMHLDHHFGGFECMQGAAVDDGKRHGSGFRKWGTAGREIP